MLCNHDYSNVTTAHPDSTNPPKPLIKQRIPAATRVSWLPAYVSNIDMSMSIRATPQPTQITLHRQSCVLEVAFADGQSFKLPFEFLRVYSPSAEVRGHGPGQEVLQTGKKDVSITRVDPVGNYALRLIFSDGHSSGIYSWDLLYAYGRNQEAMWREYLDRLQVTGAQREPAAAREH